jgi:hypothetical protein
VHAGNYSSYELLMSVHLCDKIQIIFLVSALESSSFIGLQAGASASGHQRQHLSHLERETSSRFVQFSCTKNHQIEILKKSHSIF